MTIEFELPTGFYPRCAVCDMPVETFGYELHKTVIIFVARCHGGFEMTSFTHEQFGELEGIEIGLAFTNPLRPRIGS